MAFEFKRTIGGQGRKLEIVRLVDSQAVEVGDAIETYSSTSGYGTLVDATTDPILGIVYGFCDSKGYPLDYSSPVAGTASGVDTRSVAVTSGTYCLVDVSKNTIYSALPDATPGTTTGSDKRGGWIGVLASDAGKVDESTVSRTATSASATGMNLYIHGIDPDDSTRILVSIAKHEMDGQVDVTP